MCRKHFADSRRENGGCGSVLRSGAVNQEWVMRRLRQILRCEQGANAIEYAVIASLISVAAILGMEALGGKIDTMYTNVSNKLG
jgi:pilus assembly protein Flp/PilA